jgi:hypothetical protein
MGTMRILYTILSERKRMEWNGMEWSRTEQSRIE